MTTKFTPGPWTWEDSPLSRLADRRTFLAGNGTNILIHNAAWEVSEDDKNIIAAAPEMYEALNECDNAFVAWQVGQIPGRPEDILALIQKVRTALAKAGRA